MSRGLRLVACLIIAAGLGRAQISGSLRGVVYDPSGDVIARAAVAVAQSGTGAERKLLTDNNGRFAAPGLPPGSYRVEVSHPGFQSAAREEVELTAGRAVRLDFHLRLGETRETIEVVANVPIVSTSASDWGSSIGKQELDALPLNGRDLFDLAAQEPGATVPTTSKQLMTSGMGIHVSVNGARPNQNSFRMDGIYINDASNSAPASALGGLLGLDGVQEVRLVTSPFSVEYGRAVGAVLTAVSRSGSNEWHGGAFGYFRHSALDAKNYFDSPTAEIPPLRKQQFGGTVGGPIQRNKSFFFVNYEGIRSTFSKTIRPITLTADARKGILPGRDGAAAVPVAPEVKPYLALYPLPNGRDFGDGTGEFIVKSTTREREDYVAEKIDYLFTDALRLSARYTFDDADRSVPDPFEIWTFLNDSRYQFFNTDTQFVQSATAIHNLRAGFSRVRNSDASILPDSIPGSLSFIEGQPLGAIQVTGLTDLGGLMARLRPRRFVVNDYQVSYQGTLMRGAHTFKFGAGYDRVHFNQRADLNAVGYYRFDTVEKFLQAKARSGDLMAPGSTSIRGWRQHQFNAFLQDEARLGSRLNLTLGVRYETYSTPTEVNNRIATLPDPLHDTEVTVGGPLFDNPSKLNFAPRAAIAWDVTGSGRTVIRAGAGIFFDLIGTRELIIAGVRIPPFFTRLFVPNAEFPDLLEAARKAPPPRSLDGLDFRLNQPYVGKYELSVQRQIGADSVVEIGYAGTRGIHLPGQLGNVNPTSPEILADGRLHFPAGNPRLNPAFDIIGQRRTQFNSFYHGLHVSVRRRWAGGFRAQTKYTWSKMIDESSTTVFNDNLVRDQVPTMFDYRRNRGLSDFDIRHVFAANFSYDLPEWNGLSGKIFGGWELHGLFQAQSGPPFSPEVGFDRANINPNGASLGQRPDYTGRPAGEVLLGDPARYFDPEAFLLPDAGFLGALGRNALSGPGLIDLDAALHKEFRLNERHAIRFRFEMFNVANRPNFRLPAGLRLFRSSGRRLASAGRITATTTTSRQIQLAVRWVF